MSWIEHALAQYGYAAIFLLLAAGIVGPLIPDETILVITGILIHRGTLNAVPATLCACAGSLCGITVSYELGKRGVVFVLRKMAGPHLDKAHEWFARYGRWTLFFGYFLAGVRHFTALIAGSTELPYRQFAVFAYPGGVIWVLTFVSIGYFVGDQWSRLEGMIHNGALIATGVVVVAALAWWWFKKKGASGGARRSE
jgi:membrane protein DedA with SNARE-associated domain